MALQKRLIRIGNLSPEEAQEIEAYEAQKITAQVGAESVEGEQNPGVVQSLAAVDELINKVPTA